MAFVAIEHLADRLLNQTFGQDEQTRATAKTAKTDGKEDDRARTADRFTPAAQDGSTQASAQDAGLFRVTQFTLFSAAAEFFFAQTTPPQANQAIPAQNATPITAPAVGGGSATPRVSSNTAPVQAAQAPAVSTAATLLAASTATSPGAAAGTTAAANTTASIDQQLQALNNALAALGLPHSDFAQIDRIASLINDFNPVAFADLLQQLVAIAQASQQQAAPANLTPANGNAGVANANGGGFQIQELVIKFSGVEGSAQTDAANTNGGNTTVPFSAFNLQVEEVNLTLTNSSGQAVQVQAPQQNTIATAPAAAQPATPAKAASA
jgi:hypothetical protein